MSFLSSCYETVIVSFLVKFVVKSKQDSVAFHSRFMAKDFIYTSFPEGLKVVRWLKCLEINALFLFIELYTNYCWNLNPELQIPPCHNDFYISLILARYLDDSKTSQNCNLNLEIVQRLENSKDYYIDSFQTICLRLPKLSILESLSNLKHWVKRCSMSNESMRKFSNQCIQPHSKIYNSYLKFEATQH